MPKDEKGKNRKIKHNRDDKYEQRQITQEELDKAERYAKGENIEEEEQEDQKHQK